MINWIGLFFLSFTITACSVYESQDRKDFEGLETYRLTIDGVEFLCIKPDNSRNLNTEEICQLVSTP